MLALFDKLCDSRHWFQPLVEIKRFRYRNEYLNCNLIIKNNFLSELALPWWELARKLVFNLSGWSYDQVLRTSYSQLDRNTFNKRFCDWNFLQQSSLSWLPKAMTHQSMKEEKEKTLSIFIVTPLPWHCDDGQRMSKQCSKGWINFSFSVLSAKCKLSEKLEKKDLTWSRLVNKQKTFFCCSIRCFTLNPETW